MSRFPQRLPRRAFTVVVLMLAVSAAAPAQIFNPPPPGSVYREYTKTFYSSDQWRVTNEYAENNYPAADPFYPNPIIGLPGVDKDGALRVEAVFSVWGGHTGTTPKRFRFNGNSWIDIPELQTTPSGRGPCYMAQYNATVEVPLGNLSTESNTLEGYSGEQMCYDFGWGQWGWYGIILRVYYDPALVSAPTGQITSPSSGSTVAENPTIAATASGGGGIERVEFFAHYFGYDTDGDGVYTEYHRDYHVEVGESEMTPRNHVGTAGSSPYQVTWSTGFVPDQSGTVKFVARIKGNNGLWFVTDEVIGVTFQRSVGSVALYTASGVGEQYWINVYNGTPKTSTVNISSISGATGAWLLARTWNGIDGEQESGEYDYRQVNSWTTPEFGGNHTYKYDQVGISSPTSNLNSGANTVLFFTNTSHHGIEVMWPGPAILVSYSAPVPVQLASFTGVVSGSGTALLEWKTVSEVNNYGFEVQKSPSATDGFQTIPNSFIPGHGTTLEPQSYLYEDPQQLQGPTYYRLKQIDLDNSVKYSEALLVAMVTAVTSEEIPGEYFLGQNYPNPFNPTTSIRFGLPESGSATLQLYDVTGQLVAEPVNGFMVAGVHQIELDAAGLSAGVYLYRLKAGSFVDSRKLVLVK
jgi:hypothetical protein